MASKPLKIDSLDLDLENPRIVVASNQRDAMQKILKEQGGKLINLAESIAANGLSPIDRFLVLRSERQGKFIVLEGNRCVLAMKLLKNPSLVHDLEMSEAFRKRLNRAAHSAGFICSGCVAHCKASRDVIRDAPACSRNDTNSCRKRECFFNLNPRPRRSVR